jgi:hypothetical protein
VILPFFARSSQIIATSTLVTDATVANIYPRKTLVQGSSHLRRPNNIWKDDQATNRPRRSGYDSRCEMVDLTTSLRFRQPYRAVSHQRLSAREMLRLASINGGEANVTHFAQLFLVSTSCEQDLSRIWRSRTIMRFWRHCYGKTHSGCMRHASERHTSSFPVV